MKHRITLFAIIEAFLLTTLSGCNIIGGIFKAGMGVGILIVLIVVALIIFLVYKMRKD